MSAAVGSVRFDFLTAAILNSTNVLDVTLYSLVEVYHNFRVMYCLHFQGSIVSPVGRKQAL
jgi:hypothetical protein